MGTRLRKVEIFFNMVWSEQQWARVWKSMYTVRTLAGASFLSQVRRVLKLKRVPKLENILKKYIWKTGMDQSCFQNKILSSKICKGVLLLLWDCKVEFLENLQQRGSQNTKHPEIDIYRWGQCDLTKTGVFKTKSFHPAPASRQGQRLAKRSVLKTKSFLPASGQGQRLARFGGVAEQNESGDY